jgi:hypothetical protein
MSLLGRPVGTGLLGTRGLGYAGLGPYSGYGAGFPGHVGVSGPVGVGALNTSAVRHLGVVGGNTGPVQTYTGNVCSATPVQTTVRQGGVIQGESQIQYVPYERSVVDYQPVQHIEYIPRENKVTDYYAIEH